MASSGSGTDGVLNHLSSISLFSVLRENPCIDIVRTKSYFNRMKFDFSEDKNRLLLEERGVTFQDAINSIAERGVLAEFPHPNAERYANQRILVVEIDGYTYCAPYISDGENLFLKTLFPSRKFMYLLEDK
jgi:hypothetical protein